MTTIVTYVILEVPSFVVDSPETTDFFSFTTADAVEDQLLGHANIPSIKSVAINPATISLGQDLGQRATVTVTFKDHKHIFADESYDSGTFWGKWRARYGQKLRGRRMFVIYADDPTVQGETRTFFIDSSDGPTANGEYTIIAKDVLKLADGDRAQAPILSNGFLQSDITNVSTSMVLLPAGIGDSEYPAINSPDTGFYVNVGGNEIIRVYRSVDTLNVIGRGQNNTTAVAHSAQDRVQLVLNYSATDPANIIYDLLVTYAGVDASYISIYNWFNEVNTYLSTVYTAVIAEPTDVNKLVSELIEQAGLVVWWDEIGLQIRLQVLRAIAVTADTFDADNYISGSLDIKEQPDKRISQVYTYFSKINPCVKEDQVNNYRSTAFAEDASATSTYGSAAIKKIFSRWIPSGGRAVADTLNDVLLARFVTPPRRISFDVLRGSVTNPMLGIGYQVGGWPFQDETGAAELVPVQITRLNPRADIFEVETEEMIFTTVTTPMSPDVHTVLIDANLVNVNLRTMHDSLYTAAVSGQTVNCTILEGIIVGSTSTAIPAFTVGTFAAGVTVNLIVIGRIQGKGGNGGNGATAFFASGVVGTAGEAGGTALYTRQAINLTSTSGEIWGGGGGGGGAGAFSDGSSQALGGNGGDGGAGSAPGTGGALGFGSTGEGGVGITGTTEAGGDRTSGGFFDGGEGGGPGLAGNAGATGGTFGQGAGGAAGIAIDAGSLGLITDIGAVGDIQGAYLD